MGGRVRWRKSFSFSLFSVQVLAIGPPSRSLSPPSQTQGSRNRGSHYLKGQQPAENHCVCLRIFSRGSSFLNAVNALRPAGARDWHCQCCDLAGWPARTLTRSICKCRTSSRIHSIAFRLHAACLRSAKSRSFSTFLPAVTHICYIHPNVAVNCS